jgi:hypothetical protein
MWQYPSLEERKLVREKAWQVDGWLATVDKVRQSLIQYFVSLDLLSSLQTSKLAQTMDSTILQPLTYSSLK